MHHVRRGAGKPLVLVHGLGSSHRAWCLVGLGLSRHREVIALDLPGHGSTPTEPDSDTFLGLARSLETWLDTEGLASADLVGSSLGGRLVLEMARRERARAVVALDPGGFWQGWERQFIAASLRTSGLLLRSLRPLLPMLSHNAVSRSALLAQLASRPWDLSGDLVATELQSFADTPTFDALVQDLAYGPAQEGTQHSGAKPVTIGWGRHDRLCFPAQAFRAQSTFEGSRVVWFERSGHFPMWEEPEETVRMILEAVA